LLLLWFLRRERSTLLHLPPAASLFLLVGLLSIPLIVAFYSDGPSLHVMLTVLWLFFGAGFGEGIFF
jgi:hypothetical protein